MTAATAVPLCRPGGRPDVCGSPHHLCSPKQVPRALLPAACRSESAQLRPAAPPVHPPRHLSIPLPCSAWMLAVSQFPLLRFDAEALTTTLLQHVIVGPQDFSTSALVRKAGGLAAGGKGGGAARRVLLVTLHSAIPSTLLFPLPPRLAAAEVRLSVWSPAVHQASLQHELHTAHHQPGVCCQDAAGGRAHLRQPALPRQRRAAALYLMPKAPLLYHAFA